MRVALYSRVSTDAQERDGTSLETQEHASREYAEHAGWVAAAAIRDSASGFTLDRPGIEQLRELIRTRQVDVVLAYAVDRLSRNQNHIGVLFDEAQGFGVRLEFVTERFEDTAIGRFILAARAFVAEVEREKIAERTIRGKTQRALSGRMPQATGKGMYGYVYDRETGKRRLDEDQAPIVRRIFEEFVGGSGVSRVAAGLNADGILTLGGGRWHPLTVRRILMNETYTGRTIYRRTRVEFSREPTTGKRRRKVVARDESEWIEIPDVSPAMVAPDLFARAQAILEDPERRGRGRPTGTYRLRGRARCMSCGTPMTGQALGRGRWRYYRCRNSYSSTLGGTCKERYIPRDLLEGAVFDQLVAVMTDEARLGEEIQRSFGGRRPAPAERRLRQELARVENQQKRLARLFVSGDIPEELLQAEAARLNAEQARLTRGAEAEADGDGAESPSAEEMLARMAEVVEHVAAWARNAKGDDLDLLLRALDVHVRATRERAIIEASIAIPESLQKSNLVTIAQTSA
ncbi:MAG: recombinase family protein [Dehalococcoidia bacterium]|nr:recombinase family protein [Dehalococcoidia bacterium]